MPAQPLSKRAKAAEDRLFLFEYFETFQNGKVLSALFLTEAALGAVGEQCFDVRAVPVILHMPAGGIHAFEHSVVVGLHQSDNGDAFRAVTAVAALGAHVFIR